MGSELKKLGYGGPLSSGCSMHAHPFPKPTYTRMSMVRRKRVVPIAHESISLSDLSGRHSSTASLDLSGCGPPPPGSGRCRAADTVEQGGLESAAATRPARAAARSFQKQSPSSKSRLLQTKESTHMTKKCPSIEETAWTILSPKYPGLLGPEHKWMMSKPA